MDKGSDERLVVSEMIYAQALGRQVMTLLKGQEMQRAEALAKEQAVLALEKIKTVLDDPDLDDSECFGKIEGIVEALGDIGISTLRHDW